MHDCVVIKFGGGLITNKSKLCTPDLLVIDSLVDVVIQCLDSGLRVIVVHGAGSFGHLRAKHWKLHQGFMEEHNFTPQEDCKTQLQAVNIVRKEMLTLNEIIVKAFEKRGVQTIVRPPHLWARNTGSNFSGDILANLGHDDSRVAITFGDVVNCDNGKFGILSGDDLVVRICEEIPKVQRLIFAIRGVDGILKRPPDQADENDLIPQWSQNVDFVKFHNTEIDVTGGIGLKASRGAEVAAKGIKVYIVNGEYPDRLYDACIGNETIGTEIIG